MTATPRPATTILLLRDADTASNMEVFMLQRHRRSGFLPNAWVFPGGRVDPGDALTERVLGGKQALELLALPEPQGRAMLIAGIRETFEESGIWLGSNPPPSHTRDPLNRGEIPFADLLSAHDSRLDLDQVLPWAWWVTPRAEPKRYDTRFLIARTDQDGLHDDTETTASRWICPAEALELGQDGFPMAPPTWWSLAELLSFGSVDAVFAGAPHRDTRPIEPVMRFDDSGMELVLPGHADHEEPAFEGLPHTIRSVERRWVGLRDGVITVGG